MGILNITPDSFYEGGRHLDCEKAVQCGLDLFAAGADLVDIGGESTRPGSAAISAQEELQRVIPVIKELRRKSPLPLSIDTKKARVASAAIEAGANWINDISGFRDPDMRSLAAQTGATLCVMHMQGTPETMQQNPHYPEGVVSHLLHFFDEQLELLIKAGVKREKIILDPGIGFGKTVADNLQILHNLPKFKAKGFPVLLGLSRKSFMQRILNRPASEMLAGTLACNTLAFLEGVDFLRVHDVREHRDMITLMTQLKTC